MFELTVALFDFRAAFHPGHQLRRVHLLLLSGNRHGVQQHGEGMGKSSSVFSCFRQEVTGSGRMKYVRVFKRSQARRVRTQVLKITQTLSAIPTTSPK